MEKTAFWRGFEKKAGLGDAWKKFMTLNHEISPAAIEHTYKMDPVRAEQLAKALRDPKSLLPILAAGAGLGFSLQVGKNIGDRLTKKENRPIIVTR